MGQNVFSLMDCSGYNKEEHFTIRFSWVTACGWREAILRNAAFITMWFPVKKWGWSGYDWVLPARVEVGGGERRYWGEVGAVHLSGQKTYWKCADCAAGLCWRTVAPGWWTRMMFCIEIRWRTSLCTRGSWYGQLEQQSEGQGSLMEEGSATSHD